MARKTKLRSAPTVSEQTPVLSNDLSRRGFLKQMGLVGGGLAAAACGFGSSAQSPASPNIAKPVTITYWYWADSPTVGQFFRKTIDNFNQSQTAIRVETAVLPNTDSTKQKLVQTAAAGGGGPDASYANLSFLQEFYTGNVLYPVQKYFDQWKDKNDLSKQIVDVHRIRSGQPLLYLPWAIQVDMHYYRKDLYQQANLKAPASFTELVANAKALTAAPNRYGFGIRGADQFGMLLNFCDYLLAQGIVFSDGKGGTGLDSKDAIDFSSQLLGLYWDHIAQPSALQDRFPQMVAQFQSGKLAQWGASNNHGPLLAGSDKKYLDVLGVAPWPKGTTGKAYSNLASTGNIILKSSKNKEAAWEFLTALSAPDVSIEFAKIVGFLPARSSAAKAPDFADLPWMQVTTQSAPQYGTYPYWHKNWVAFSQTTGLQGWQQALQKSISVDSLMKQLAGLMRDYKA